MKYIVVIDGVESTKHTYNVWSAAPYDDGALVQDTRIFESDDKDEFMRFVSSLHNEDSPDESLRDEDRHTVNCYFCGKPADERECLPADQFNNNDGGDMCPDCIKEKVGDKEPVITFEKHGIDYFGINGFFSRLQKKRE